MSSLVLTLAVEDAVLCDAIGIKEAVTMDLEKYGDVKVLRVDVCEPEQMSLDGVPLGRGCTSRRMSLDKGKPSKPAAPAQTEVSKPKRPMPVDMFCCLTCALYRKGHGQDSSGAFYWGECRRNGELVYDLKDQCEGWERKTREVGVSK